MIERTARHITDQFVSTLPENKAYYKLNDLRSCGFPEFLIRRIQIELKWNLNEKVTPPETEWVDMQSRAVRQSWQQFLQSITDELQLPQNRAKEIIKKAVSDVTEILVQPRKNIPIVLFEGEDSLSDAELAERTELLVVYTHFSSVLNAYMQRKKKQELMPRRCKKIIEQVDEKVTRDYTPLQWGQMLEPLFVLSGSRVDTNLLRLFFEDRNMPEIAKKFDMMGTSVSRPEFIEVLSSPEKETESKEKKDQFSSSQETTEEIEGEPAPFSPDMREKVESSEEFSVLEVESEEQQAKEELKHQKEDETQLPEQQKVDEFGNETQPLTGEEEPESLNAIYSEDSETEEEVTEEELSSRNEEERDLQEEDSTIWEKFMDTGEEDQPENFVEEYSDEPVLDLPQKEEKNNKEELEELFADRKSYFVEQLFNGSERAYEESLREIAQKDSWKAASKLIEKNIFKRNMINIYSEAAVDFTDRLQDYFLEK